MGIKEKRRSDNIKVALMSLALAAIAIGGAVFAYVGATRAAQYDADTFCRKDGDYPRTAILIDATDSLDESKIKAAGERINKLLKSELATGEWVGMYVLDESNLALPSPRAALCNPGGERQCNPLIENCQDAQLKFKRDFLSPMEKAINGLADSPPRPSSPILEMIRAVALARDFDSSQKRKLIIVSDMLQNTRQYSHHRGRADFAEWEKSDAAREFLSLSLSGVDVRILYVKRPQYAQLQTRGHVLFWEKYFAAVGAKISGLESL